ncbi:MAG: class I SAM-dependent methyltransferase [Brasilonema angustatum HA4187-MV1]|jgi:SAM-dependent methyltransferase|nr:class I SAM-dependent methyltransferase [Brasilonema angustatum HA4187-MV1]
MDSSDAVSSAVAKLYNTYPFPPDPLLDEPPPGYNWRWNWNTAYNFCTGRKPERENVRILDAGCGTGAGTEYIVHLNPHAQVVAIDLSAGAIAVARERCQRSKADGVEFHNLSLYDVEQVSGQFDYINCVGVLHHLPDPIKGIQSLAGKLAPGGLMHIFVYAELGRWEISLMQKAIALLQGDRRGDYEDGVKVGREIFANLPENNRLLKREKERWSLENHRDGYFADMYVHPQEIDYRIDTLFELIDASGLEFIGFSNPLYWQLERLIGQQPDLMERAAHLSERQRYRLTELLDPEISHYEFFLGRPPISRMDWSDDATVLNSIPERSPCMEGWPSQVILDYNYQVARLSEAEYAFLEACDHAQGQETVETLIQNTGIDLEGVRSLQKRQLILLTPKLQ